MKLTPMPDGSFQLAQADHASPLQGTPADPHAPDSHGADATHAGTAAEGGHGGAFPPFSPEHYASQLIWLAITFGALYFILSRYALPRIAAILAERQARIDTDLGEAQRLKAESDAAIAAYEQSLAEARARAQRIASETREGIAREADANRKQIEGQLAAKLAEAETQIAATKTQALGNVRGIATDATAQIVSHLTGISPAPADVDSAVSAAMTGRTVR
jgi:F-type H+-transporting ATPase subunit b